MAQSYTYCTHRDVEDVFPDVNNYDSKEQIFGWKSHSSAGLANKLWICYGTGLITQLYQDGQEMSYCTNDSSIASDWFANGLDGH
jgi:hypothetical protein